MPTRRKGVTLLEVLFSIGIVAIGILGVAMTLVLSGRLAAEGQIADQADRLGRNAIREVSIRGYDRPTGPDGMWAAVPVNGQAYCLDPLGVAANQTTPEFGYFPAHSPVAVPGPRMFRIGVRPFPGNQLVLPVPPIGLPLAQSLFIADDDLVFMKPSDRTLPPVQRFSGSAATQAGLRDSQGAMSWFATFQSDDYENGTAMMQIVVCSRRDPQEAERLLAVERIDGEDPTVPAVINPADPRGQVIKIGVRPGQPASDLDVRDGEWVVLAGQRGTKKSFQWFRVTNTTEVLPAGTPDVDGLTYAVDTRDLGVFGRPWTFQRLETQAAIPGHVVGVYEKTVRFNGSGLWR